MRGIFLRSEDIDILPREAINISPLRGSRTCFLHALEDVGQLLGPVSRRSVSLWLLNPILDLPASSPELSKTSTVAARFRPPWGTGDKLGSSKSLIFARICVRLPPADGGPVSLGKVAPSRSRKAAWPGIKVSVERNSTLS